MPHEAEVEYLADDEMVGSCKYEFLSKVEFVDGKIRLS